MEDLTKKHLDSIYKAHSECGWTVCIPSNDGTKKSYDALLKFFLHVANQGLEMTKEEQEEMAREEARQGVSTTS